MTDKPKSERKGPAGPVAADGDRLGRSGWQFMLCAAFFKMRGLLVVGLLFVMFFVTYGEQGGALLNWLIGLALFAAGWVLRIRSQQYLRYRLRDGAGLATTGPYACVRNPVYIGNVIGLAGLCVACRLYWLVPVAVVWGWLVYHLSVCFEETRLLKRYGEPYHQYCQRVNRWRPARAAVADESKDRASLATAARVEWQGLLLLLVPLAKEWARGSHGGYIHAILADVVGFIQAYRTQCLVTLITSCVVLAAWNLKQRASRACRAE